MVRAVSDIAEFVSHEGSVFYESCCCAGQLSGRAAVV